MQSLFAGQIFSNVMNARLKQMQAEIEKLKCSEVTGISDEELSAKAEKFAEKYVAKDIPKVDRAALEKTGKESSGKKYWEIPFSGGKEYFTYSPSEHETGHSVDKIEGARVFIQIEENSHTPLSEAEKRAERTLGAIEKSLDRMQQDADTHFSKEKIKASAEYILKKKREECAKLGAGGYSVR